MFKKAKDFLNLIKFSHTIFALPFAFIGFFLALDKYKFDFLKLLYVILCMFFARSAAMAFNRYLDRNIDKENPRTKNREIPMGRIKPQEAIIFTILMSVLFVFTTLLINKLVFYLSFVALFIILFYSYTKRITPLCHFVLGLGLSLAPIGAYLVVSQKFDLIPIIFSILVLFWVSGFDIIYSTLDYNFDKSKNLKSIPVLLGINKALMLSKVLHSLSILSLLLALYLGKFGVIAYIGAFIFTLLIFIEHKLAKPNDENKINLAFATINGWASVILGVFIILDILFK